MTLLRPGMTARYILPDGSVYEVTVSSEGVPDDDSEDVAPEREPSPERPAAG